MVKMIDLDRHSDCPLSEALAAPQIPWTGMRYACLKVLHAYCKVFDRQELYDLIVRKTCQSCKCPRESHAIYQEQVTSVRERLGFKQENQTSRIDPRQLGYTWVPPGVMTSAKVQRYFDKIPQEKVPKIGASGERYRERQITLQLPKQDLALDHCKHVEPQHRASYEDFVAARNEIALDIGYIKDASQSTKCVNCDDRIAKSDLAVIAPKFRDQMMWHPKCFTCATCDELLVDLTYCVHEEKIYCERHYAELLKPRCNACDEHQTRQMLISNDESLKRLQDQIEIEIIEAAGKEIHGFNAMKDGVLYKDGIRIDPSEISDYGTEQRQVIGRSKNSLETDEDQEIGKTRIKTTEKSKTDYDQVEVCEEPCVKKHVEHLTSNRQIIEEQTTDDDDKRTNITQSTVKTQIGQTNVENYSPHSHDFDSSTLAPSKLESELETATSQQIETISDQSTSTQEIHFDEYHREAPDGQDVPEPQYSDDYLRSLDGIKIRPLVRDDGSGRRRAFKKRRSSESTSSRESRASREEELKMFTSLEEEEFESIRRGDSDYVPIRYSSDPNLIKTGKHQRRHKKSPIKDCARLDKEGGSRSSLEMLDEENISPWGDVKPEHYKDTEFWKREKAVSIEEENEENTQSLHDNVRKQKADEATTSASPIKNIPKLSSFEEATPSQHENVVSTLNQQQQQSQDKPKKVAEKDVVENVSSDNDDDDDNETLQLIASCDNKTSDETEDETFACDVLADIAENTDLRRSPRIADIEQYELEDAKRSLSISPQTNNENLSISQLTQTTNSATTTTTTTTNDNPQLSRSIENVSSSLGIENMHGSTDRPKTPVIEILGPSDEMNATTSAESGDEIHTISEPSLLEGISDFYDFNASINPSRSPSIERKLSKSRSPSKESDRKSPKLTKNEDTSVNDLAGLSDFYDFNATLNKHAYGHQSTDEHIAPRSTTDYIVDKLTNKRSKSKSPSVFVSLPKNEELCLQKEEGGGIKNHNDTPNPLDTPITPEYQRSLSANMRYVESMRDDYRQNMYKRSRYIGESMDFENDFEDLREQTRHFTRSRSRSRSPILEEEEASTSRQAEISARRELQDRILDEITRTTINYQDFSRDMNKMFIDYERRTSDSALIQKPEIMIQIDDDSKGENFSDDNDDMLEGDEYHHFRRFSLNQEHQVDNDYVYLQGTGLNRSTYPDNYESDEKYKQELNVETPTEIVDNTEEENSDHAEEDVDSESEDDRQTVVDVEDEIDEDIWDYERPEESNEQSECEEAEREMDRYANKNAQDWNEEGAAGGSDEIIEQIENFEDDTISIDKMYNDAVKDTEESGIEKDYDTIINAINKEENDEFGDSDEVNDSMSVKSEDLLDEILREDETNRYKHWSPRRDNKFEVTRNFIEHESTGSGKSSLHGTKSHTISSTRLRSRYGIGPSPPANINLENIDSINVDLNYKPKKEYKWRKNFKLDEDETERSSEMAENSSNLTDNLENTEQLVLEDDIGLDGEAVLTKSGEEESIGSSEMSKIKTDVNDSTETDDEKYRIEETEEIDGNALCNKTNEVNSNKMLQREDMQEFTDHNIESFGEILEENISQSQNTKNNEKDISPKPIEETTTTATKKKKIKRKTRKVSKGSIGGDDDDDESLEDLQNDNIDISNDTGAKKKIKKKKKTRGITSPNTNIKNSPSQDNMDISGAANFITSEKTRSSSPLKNVAVLISETRNMQSSPELKEPSKSPVVGLEVGSSNKTKSKSRSPDPIKSEGSISESNDDKRTSPKSQSETNDSTGVFDLMIKDGGMYPLC